MAYFLCFSPMPKFSVVIPFLWPHLSFYWLYNWQTQLYIERHAALKMAWVVLWSDHYKQYIITVLLFCHAGVYVSSLVDAAGFAHGEVGVSLLWENAFAMKNYLCVFDGILYICL